MIKQKYTANHNLNFRQLPNHLYRKLIIGKSGSGKANTLINLVNHQSDIDKIHLYTKYPHEPRNQL